MIKSFISLVAKDILQLTGSDLKDIAVVFPNRRAGSIFRNELVNQLKEPAWSPGIFSVDDWLIGLSGLKKADKLEELALLFPIARKYLPHIEGFDDFMDLGEIVLADFEDIDKYMADPVKLFTTLKEGKKIDSLFDVALDEELVERVRMFWSGFGTGQSSHQEKWLQIWENLLPLYREFNQSLLEKGMGSSGLCYRKAAEDLTSGKISTGRYKKLIFAGFNILTIVEETIFKYLRDNGFALFYWDYHPYYLQSPNEAGKFLQQYLKTFPPPAGFQPFPEGSSDFFNQDGPGENIQVVPVTSNTGQVQALLNDLRKRPDVNRGIILSDEGLFSDLLSSWPDEMPVNFTSGYPLRDTLASGLFYNLAVIFQDFSLSKDHKAFKSEFLLTFLNHPWAKWLIGDSTGYLIEQIERRFLDSVPADFLSLESGFFRWIANLETTDGFLVRVNEMGARLLAYKPFFYPIEQAAIEMIMSQSLVIKDLIKKYSIKLDSRSLSKIWSQFLNTNKITLETDREACNQVTGILETRLMDFDEVFILSFNEGIWPSKALPGSLIPYSIRKIFHLPTAENRDAMYAYYFYRLIQRTKVLYIYYLSGHRDDGIRSGEKSRYITQLEFELQRKIEVVPEPPARINTSSSAIVIKKEGLVKDSLDLFLAGHPEGKSLSPSALNEYLDCRLRFALRRIYKIREPDEIAYASEPKGFGILIHQVMNRLYRDFVGKDLGPGSGWFKGILIDQTSLSDIIHKEYNLVLKEPGVVDPGGKEILGMEVVRQFINSILEYDKQFLPLKIVGLEQNFQLEYPIEVGLQKVSVNLNGIIDRIDQVENVIRIVDYKTGNCDLNVKLISDLFNRGSAKRPKEAFQVLMYCEFFCSKISATEDLVPSLFRPGRFRSGDHDHRVQLDGKNIFFSEIRNDFNDGLKIVLEELFNPEIPFDQCEDEQNCRYCPFTGICSR